MSQSKKNIVNPLKAESETLRMLRMKFHNYSKSQQISIVRPPGEQPAKTSLKENEVSGLRQTLKLPMRNDLKLAFTTKSPFLQKNQNVLESDFTKKAREMLARSLGKNQQTTTTHSTQKTHASSIKIMNPEKCILIRFFKT